MKIGKVVRSEDDIKELASECIEHESSKSTEFDSYGYTEGVRAALRWLFSDKAENPLDVKPLKTRHVATIEYAEGDKL